MRNRLFHTRIRVCRYAPTFEHITRAQPYLMWMRQCAKGLLIRLSWGSTSTLIKRQFQFYLYSIWYKHPDGGSIFSSHPDGSWFVLAPCLKQTILYYFNRTPRVIDCRNSGSRCEIRIANVKKCEWTWSKWSNRHQHRCNRLNLKNARYLPAR